MTSPDLDVPARVSCLTAAKSPFGSLYCCVPVFLILSFSVVGAVPSRAQAKVATPGTPAPKDQAQDQTQNQKDQSVAEAARQERARKESQQKKSKHVYTADDLKRDHILTPEDRAQLEARKNQQPPAPTNTQQPQVAVSGSALAQDVNGASAPKVDATAPATTSTNVPLGDVARRLRK